IDYSQGGVREWAIQNACLWIRDYHVDGLRLDAVHAIYDDSPRHVLAELAERVREVNPRALVISEMELDDYRPIEEWAHDAQWADRFHHEVHVLLTGEQDGYYEQFGSRAGRKREFERFSAFGGEDVPDPQDPATFERSKLDRSHADEELRAFYRELLTLRRELPREVEVEVDEQARTLIARRGDVVLHAD